MSVRAAAQREASTPALTSGKGRKARPCSSANRARGKALEVLDALGIDRPEWLRHLPEICAERGAFVREAWLEHAEGRLTAGKAAGIITVKPHPGYASRTRFTIAHELGHFEIHRSERRSMLCDEKALGDWSGRNLEKEANIFAAELLMPERFIGREVHAAPPDLRRIEALADDYGTSLFATTRRYLDLTREACAAVFFTDYFVRYAWKSQAFRKNKWVLRPNVDFLVPILPIHRHEQVRDMSALPASVAFLGDQPAGGQILVQARYFPALGRGMALLWAPAQG